jgi:predicted transposase/invertase (TIGR01784 family)
MAAVAHEPVKQAMSRIRQLSADEEARRLAFVRERALHDEVSLLNDARREGREEGRAEGREEGREEGQEAGREAVARNLIAMRLLSDAQIATASGLTEAQVQALRER